MKTSVEISDDRHMKAMTTTWTLRNRKPAEKETKWKKKGAKQKVYSLGDSIA